MYVGTPDTCLQPRECPAGASCLRWPLAPSQWHPPPTSHSQLTPLFTLRSKHEVGRPTPGSWDVPDGKVEGGCLVWARGKMGCPLVWDREPFHLQSLLGSQVSWEDQLVSDFTLMNGGPQGCGEEEQTEGKAKEGERKARREERGAGVTGREGRRPGQGVGPMSTLALPMGTDGGRLCFSWTQHRRSPNRGFSWGEQLMLMGDLGAWTGPVAAPRYQVG